MTQPLNMPLNLAQIIEYSCPICGKSNSLELHRSNLHGITLDHCLECGNIFRKNFLSKKSWILYMRKLHRSIPNSNYYQRELVNYYMVDRMIEFEDNDRVLWIDSGLGKAANDIPAKVTTLQLSETHHMFDRYMYNNDCRNTLYIKDCEYNVILCFDYLQYIPDVLNYLKDLRTKITSDGKFYLSVPTIDVFSSDVVRNGMVDIYANYFTQETLENLFISAGWKIEDTWCNVKNRNYILSPGNETKTYIVKNSAEKFNKFIETITLFDKGNVDELRKINPLVCELYFRNIFAEPEQFDINMVKVEADEVLRIFGNYIPMLASVAQYHILAHNYKAAYEILSYCVQFVADKSLAEMLAQCYYDMGIFDESQKWFSKSMELTPPDPEQFGRLVASIIARKDLEGDINE